MNYDSVPQRAECRGNNRRVSNLELKGLVHEKRFINKQNRILLVNGYVCSFRGSCEDANRTLRLFFMTPRWNNGKKEYWKQSVRVSSNVISLQRTQDIAFACLCCFQEAEWITRGGRLGDPGQGE